MKKTNKIFAVVIRKVGEAEHQPLENVRVNQQELERLANNEYVQIYAVRELKA